MVITRSCGVRGEVFQDDEELQEGFLLIARMSRVVMVMSRSCRVVGMV